MSNANDPRGMIASGVLRSVEAGVLTRSMSYEQALEVADHVLETLDAWDCEVVHVPPGTRVSIRGDRAAQIALLNAAEESGRT